MLKFFGLAGGEPSFTMRALRGAEHAHEVRSEEVRVAIESIMPLLRDGIAELIQNIARSMRGTDRVRFSEDECTVKLLIDDLIEIAGNDNRACYIYPDEWADMLNFIFEDADANDLTVQSVFDATLGENAIVLTWKPLDAKRAES